MYHLFLSVKAISFVPDLVTVYVCPAVPIGEFLVYSGQLYKVATAIASGAKIVVGTNVVVATVMDYVNTRLSLVMGDMGTNQGESNVASKAYAVGECLVYNGQLYKVTAPISVGNTLTVGTNIAVHSVSAINSNLEWKTLNPVTGNGNITLPSSFSEIHIFCRETTFNVSFAFHMLPSDFSGISTIRNGFYINSVSYGACVFNINSPTSINLNTCSINGPDYASTAITSISYR